MFLNCICSQELIFGNCLWERLYWFFPGEGTLDSPWQNKPEPWLLAVWVTAASTGGTGTVITIWSSGPHSHYGRECWFVSRNTKPLDMYVFISVCHLGVSYHAISLFMATSIKPGLSLSALGTGSVQSYFLFYILPLLSSCFLPLVSHVYYLTGHSSSKTEHLAWGPRQTVAFSHRDFILNDLHVLWTPLVHIVRENYEFRQRSEKSSQQFNCCQEI